MTTIIALASRHAVVMGADSLATQSKQMVETSRLYEYFEPGDEWKLKLGPDGVPVLKNVWDVTSRAEHIPFNQSLHVNKLFKIGDLPVGAMFTGVTSLGNLPIRSIVSEFVDQLKSDDQLVSKYKVEELGKQLMDLLGGYYDKAFDPSRPDRPDLELLVAGYDHNEVFPTVMRVNVRARQLQIHYRPGQFGVSFGGQMDWIQRIVFGTDNANLSRLRERTRDLLSQYRLSLLEHVGPHGLTDLPEPGRDLDLFHGDWRLQGLQADWADFSEQNAINCVDFFLRIMIGSQDVSSRLPTVGGDVHIAVIRRDGFHPVSREVWKHGNHEVSIPEVGR